MSKTIDLTDQELAEIIETDLIFDGPISESAVRLRNNPRGCGNLTDSPAAGIPLPLVSWGVFGIGHPLQTEIYPKDIK